ncbi:glycosyltransferase family 25 protein [Acinetobacter sp. B5B]|uniref:glycosyltransferase family 25 protein n=1 Tax=Acinetobacter baretiae TaxID=2605383 RepID=UPI0018C24122|nr:glycosyltransferase family 25 protein [Acinetobacter baretiae]MBF7682335.1 glycosyltransferase family 25 protein [Acinetobacter baretiae]
MKILMINLEQSTDRLQQQQQQFQTLGLTFERLPAVSIAETSIQDYEKLAFNGQRPMKQSELACFLSHKKAWHAVIAANEPCLILEDDAVLVRDLSNILDDISVLNDVDLVNLEVHGRKKIIAKQPTFSVAKDYQLFSMYQDRSGAAAYVLFPSGARKLLTRLDQSYPKLADEFISSCYILNTYQIEPAAALQSDKADMYGISVSIAHGSVIGHIQNSAVYPSSMSVLLKFKLNRAIQQLILGGRHLSVMPFSQRRYIHFDKSKFKMPS